MYRKETSFDAGRTVLIAAAFRVLNFLMFHCFKKPCNNITEVIAIRCNWNVVSPPFHYHEDKISRSTAQTYLMSDDKRQIVLVIEHDVKH